MYVHPRCCKVKGKTKNTEFFFIGTDILFRCYFVIFSLTLTLYIHGFFLCIDNVCLCQGTKNNIKNCCGRNIARKSYSFKSSRKSVFADVRVERQAEA